MAPVAAIVMVGFSSSVSDSDGSMERLGLPERAKHEMGDVGARNEEAAPQILPVRRAVGAGHGLVGQPWRSYDGPVQAAVAQDVLHQGEIAAVVPGRSLVQRAEKRPHEGPLPL